MIPEFFFTHRRGVTRIAEGPSVGEQWPTGDNFRVVLTPVSGKKFEGKKFEPVLGPWWLLWGLFLVGFGYLVLWFSLRGSVEHSRGPTSLQSGRLFLLLYVYLALVLLGLLSYNFLFKEKPTWSLYLGPFTIWCTKIVSHITLFPQSLSLL